MAKYSLKLNPATGELETVLNPEEVVSVKKIEITRNCDAGLSIGDFVFESLSIDNYVEKAVDNTSIAPVIGIVISKPTSTSATIVVLGLVGGFSGLTKGKNVFLSTLGEATNVLVTSGYHQVLGYAESATEVFIRPQLMRVKRI